MSLPAAKLRANFPHLNGDAAWFGLLFGSTLTFLTVYATRLGATLLQISIITSGPAILNLLISLPGATWLQGRRLPRAVFLMSVAQRAGFAALVFLPWLFRLPAWQILAVIVIVVVIAIPGTLLAIAFMSMIAEVVPPQHRAEVMGWRNAVMSISIMVSVLACGWLLDQTPAPVNYQIVFGLGAIGAAMSSYHLWRVRPLAGAFAPPAVSPAAPAAPARLVRLDLLGTAFGPLVGAYLCFYITQNLNVPINPQFWIRDLHITDG
jgi:MFS family permease